VIEVHDDEVGMLARLQRWQVIGPTDRVGGHDRYHVGRRLGWGDAGVAVVALLGARGHRTLPSGFTESLRMVLAAPRPTER